MTTTDDLSSSTSRPQRLRYLGLIFLFAVWVAAIGVIIGTLAGKPYETALVALLLIMLGIGVFVVTLMHRAAKQIAEDRNVRMTMKQRAGRFALNTVLFGMMWFVVEYFFEHKSASGAFEYAVLMGVIFGAMNSFGNTHILGRR